MTNCRCRQQGRRRRRQETDAAAEAKWQHYVDGTDHEAIAWRDSQSGEDPNKDPFAGPNRRRYLTENKLPTKQGVLCGSYAKVAQMLDAKNARRLKKGLPPIALEDSKRQIGGPL